MQNQNSKPKTDLKRRAYKYSIGMIEFLDTLPKDTSSQVIAKQLLRDAKKINNPQLEYLLNETKELANMLGSSILTLKGKK